MISKPLMLCIAVLAGMAMGTSQSAVADASVVKQAPAPGAIVVECPMLTKGPYLQAPGKDTMTICWETTNGVPGVVLFGKGPVPDHPTGPIQPTRVDIPADTTNSASASTRAFFVYEAVLTGLSPGTTYHYAIQCGEQRGGLHTFTTLDPASPDVTFIVYGDSRSGPETHQKLAEQFAAYKPAFILHSGDLVSKGEKYSLWGRQFFFPLANVIDRIPMLPSIGNHEGNGVNYLAYFHLPPPERYYSFDAGPVHVLVLDDHKTSDKDEQFSFAKRDLAASRAPWKVVLLHAPMFNLGGHKSFWKGGYSYLPLFHSNQVDVVFAGHSHMYERFRPLVSRAQPDGWPILHITSGGGGAPLYETVSHPTLLAFAKKYHFLVATPRPKRLPRGLLTWRVRNSTGSPLASATAFWIQTGVRRVLLERI